MNGDPYLHPRSGVLLNRAGFTSQQKLDDFERDVTSARFAQLYAHPIEGAFDIHYLRAIHRYIFQDVYSWAGQFRTTQLSKFDYIGGPVHRFASPEEVGARLDALFSTLARKDFLKHSSPSHFATAAAPLFGRLNAIHPFREGNGRTQRHFFRELARHAGHSLNFGVITQERMIEASIRAADEQPDTMVRLFEDAIHPGRHPALNNAIDFLRTHGKSAGIDWNRLYLASALPGRTYSGTLVGLAGSNFLMREGRGWLVVGNADELPADLRRGDAFSFTAVHTLRSAPPVPIQQIDRLAIEALQQRSDFNPSQPVRQQPLREGIELQGTVLVATSSAIAVALDPNRFVVLPLTMVDPPPRTGEPVDYTIRNGQAVSRGPSLGFGF